MPRALTVLCLLSVLVTNAVAQTTFDLRRLDRQLLEPLAGTTRRYTIGDVNRDRLPDVLISKDQGQDGLNFACPPGGFLNVTGTHMPQGTGRSRDAALVDIDSDGDLDAVFVGDDGLTCDHNRIYLNSGDGHFTVPKVRLLPAGCGTCVEAADLNGDSLVDLFVGGFDEPHRVYINIGGNYAPGLPLPPVPLKALDAALLDADRDGDFDIVIAQAEGASSLLLNDGTAGFVLQSATRFDAGQGAAAAVATGDVDGDGDVDVVFAGFETGFAPRQHRLMVQGMGGAFTLRPLPTRFDARSIALADFDGDGDLDLALGNTQPGGSPTPIGILANDGLGNFAAESGWPGPPLQAHATAAADLDFDGDAELLVGGQDFDHYYVGFERHVYAAAPPRVGSIYSLVITSQFGHSPPAAVAVLVGTRFARDRLHVPPHGWLGIADVAVVQGFTLPSPGGELRLSLPIPPTSPPGSYLFQALMLPGAVQDARLTNVFGDWIE